MDQTDKNDHTDKETARETMKIFANGCRDQRQSTRFDGFSSQRNPIEAISSIPEAQEEYVSQSFEALKVHLNGEFARLAADAEQMAHQLREAEERSEQLRHQLLESRSF